MIARLRNRFFVFGFLFVLGVVAPSAGHAQSATSSSDITAPAPQNVVITNTSANPALVRNLDEPTRRPFQQKISVDIFGGGHNGSSSVAVPIGKQLVIQHISFRSEALLAGNNFKVRVFTTFGGVDFAHHPDFHDQGYSSTEPRFVANQPLLAYADGGTSVSVGVFVKNAQSTATFTALSGVITGYLIDVPSDGTAVTSAMSREPAN